MILQRPQMTGRDDSENPDFVPPDLQAQKLQERRPSWRQANVWIT
jgi:hypothetical protein